MKFLTYCGRVLSICNAIRVDTFIPQTSFIIFNNPWCSSIIYCLSLGNRPGSYLSEIREQSSIISYQVAFFPFAYGFLNYITQAMNISTKMPQDISKMLNSCSLQKILTSFTLNLCENSFTSWAKQSRL
jgi:hypothetical protein